MKALVAGAVVLVLGLAGAVVVYERNKGRTAGPGAHEGTAVLTISTGEAVDIDANVPRRGLVIVEFTADW